MKHGLVDIHIHGQAGLDVMSGDPEQLLELSLRLAKQGVAGFLATFVTASREKTIAALEAVKLALGRERGARILGVHLEGPFIHPERRGVHNPRHIRVPDAKEAREWVAAGEGLVRLVTLAPELPGASAVIRALDRKGVRVSMGHSAATYAQASAGRRAGARSVTHLFNAMNPVHHREPGLAGFALTDDEIYSELIADGVHVSDPMIGLVLRARPWRRVILISDGFFLTGLRGSAAGAFGGLQVRRFPDGSLRLGDGTLAGSNATLAQIVQRVLKLKLVPEAQVLAMASTNPLQMLGLSPDVLRVRPSVTPCSPRGT